MDTNKKNQKKRASAQKAKSASKSAAAPRRQPGANAKSKQPQKAPHAQPRKHAPVQEPVRVTPEVVYLAPKPFSRSRLILHLATVVAVVLALMLGLSVFFKVENIVVSGCQQYSAWQVKQASGVEEGDQLLTFNRAKASGKIISSLPYVKTVRIGITLPDTVNIEIVETQVCYAVEAVDGTWWLMNSDGKIVEQAAAGTEDQHTKILGVSIQDPAVGEQVQAYENQQAQTDAEGNVVPVTVTAQQRLNAVIDIAQYLEGYSIIGEAASIDVTDLYDIELWYGQKFQVLLGDSGELNHKIKYLKAVVDDYEVSRPYETGVLDISDPNWIEFQSFTE